ncbi:MAG: AlpA family phage regulatory protein [Rubrivivax sp.]
MLRHESTAGNVSPSEQRPMFARMPSVVRFTGLGRSTIYRMIAAKEFPGPIKLGPRAVGWHWSDLDTWSETRPHSAH